MYRATGRNGIIWDAKNDSPLCRFVDGVAQVDSKEKAERLMALGLSVEEIAAEDAPSEKWTAEQLRVYAREKNIELGEATKKADMLVAVLGATR